jgi:hypothetical protein
MKLPKLTIRRAVVGGALLLVAAGIIAPYLHADRFSGRIRQALERSLNRKVEIGEVRFNLFRGPGFSLRSVVIHDDPAAGIEPFAYVTSIEARVRLRSLYRGRLEFASLRLEEPSVNLVKTGEGPWNFQPLLNQAAAAPLPAISVRGGRLNFKLGAVKSVFYFSNADLDVRPPRTAGGAFELEFSGQPARTDRTARGFGTLSGRGRWRPGPASGGNLELDLNLAKSSMGELVALIYGHDIGVHGQVGGEARLRGPVSQLEVTGTLQLSDFHRWDLLPPYAEGGPLNFRGRLDLLSQNIDIETALSSQPALAVRFRAYDYLTRPRWAVSLTLNRFPIPLLVDVARHMGARLAVDLQIDGSLLGVITYSSEGGVQGGVSLEGASIRLPKASPVLIEDAHLTLDGSRVRLPPALIRAGDRETARLEFDYRLDAQRLDLRLSTDNMSIAALQSEGGLLPGMLKPEFFSRLRDGAWAGWLRYSREGNSPGQWSGAVRIRNSLVTLPGFAQPLELRTAEVKLQEERINVERIEATAGETEFRGEYVYRPEAARPHHISCRIPKLQASEIEKLLEPTLRRPQGFFSRTLGLRRVSVPDWLEARHAEGTVEIGSLLLAGESFESVRLRFFWDGPDLDVARFQAHVEGGEADGHLTADFRGPLPVYEIGGRLESASWRGGRLDGDGSVRTSGMGDDLYLNLRAEGYFRAQSVTLGQDVRVRAFSGSWDLQWDRKQPRLQLAGLRLADGEDVLTGQGQTLEDERLRIDLLSGERRLRLAGTLKPIRLEVVESR